jgi:hypothetical protein
MQIHNMKIDNTIYNDQQLLTLLFNLIKLNKNEKDLNNALNFNCLLSKGH